MSMKISKQRKFYIKNPVTGVKRYMSRFYDSLFRKTMIRVHRGCRSRLGAKRTGIFKTDKYVPKQRPERRCTVTRYTDRMPVIVW